MELIHYSHEKIDSWRPVSYLQKKDYKPSGIWFSVREGKDPWGWKEWCVAEEFRLDKLKHSHVITLDSSANLLILNTPDKMWQFTKQYGRAIDWRSDYLIYCDWSAISKLYQGILIYPYFYQFRLGWSEFAWYYPWDCASGCIWDINAITDFSHTDLT